MVLRLTGAPLVEIVADLWFGVKLLLWAFLVLSIVANLLLRVSKGTPLVTITGLKGFSSFSSSFLFLINRSSFCCFSTCAEKSLLWIESEPRFGSLISLEARYASCCNL